MKIHELARPGVLEIDPYKPGKPISEVAKEMGLKKIIKLASNESPLGPSKLAQAAMKKEIKDLSLYPEGSGKLLREKLSRLWDVTPENIILGNGSNEIIELLLRTFLHAGQEVLTSKSTFVVYALSTKVCDGKIVEVPMKYYTYDLDAIAEKINENTKLIKIANPNNPTGTMVDSATVDKFMKKVPQKVIVAFDEAYGEFANPKTYPNVVKYIKEGRHVITLRTFSKIYGLAGIRIGYGIAGVDMISLLNKVRQPFNVNTLAQVAALAALDDEDYRHRMISLVDEGRRYLYNEFYKMGLFYVPSEANFVLVKVGEGAKTFRELLKKGVIVRSMDEYDLAEFIRVTIGTMPQNRMFIKALKEVLKFNK
jgi:histidinol-phosphate aminotransferase